jgi:hypothetical protein
MLFTSEFANLGPGFRCQASIVIGLEHSPNSKNSQPGLRVAGCGQLKIIGQGSYLRREARHLARRHRLANMRIERFFRFAPLLIEKFCLSIDRSRVDPVI